MNSRLLGVTQNEFKLVDVSNYRSGCHSAKPLPRGLVECPQRRASRQALINVSALTIGDAGGRFLWRVSLQDSLLAELLPP